MSAPAATWTYPRCRALKVHDGDTVQLEVDQGLSTYRHIWVRIAHINAPELKHEKGTAVRERLALLLAAEPLTVTTIRDRTEKYGRYLAAIVNAHGVEVGQQLLEEGLAVPYEGGRR
jgi:micrococcal nuclease